MFSAKPAAYIHWTSHWVASLSVETKRRHMTSQNLETTASAEATSAWESALEQSHDVRDKVEDCADDLASKNEAVKQLISDGATTLSARKLLNESKVVEARVQECADDLHRVTETLAHGVEDLKTVELALARSRKALARTESSLAVSKEEERRSKLLALHDAATGLPNRVLFDDRLSHALSLAERQQWTLAVMFLDLDRFKSINDQFGHAAGDAVLKEVAQRLLQHARDEDTVCRNGGDEFLYLLVNPQGTENVERIARNILAKVSVPIQLGTLELVISPSIGIALFPDHAVNGADLIARADAAMYRAKRGLRGYAVHGQAEALDSELTARLERNHELRSS